MSEKTTLATINDLQACLRNLGDDEDTEEILIFSKKLFVFSWLLDAVRFYRHLDFFADTAYLTDSQLTEKFIALRKRNLEQRCLSPDGERQRKWFDIDDLLGPSAEIHFLSTDKKSVWFSDLEADVCEENRSYTSLIYELSHISRGLFEAEFVEEDWRETGASKLKIEVSFKARGQRWQFEPNSYDDWLDLSTPINMLNEMLAPTGYRYVFLETMDQCGCVVVLTEDEQNLIFTKRKITTPERYGEEEFSLLEEAESRGILSDASQ